MSFAESLQTGKVGESLIARYMMARGHSVLPVYEIEKDTGKGPQLFAPMGEQLVAPDMLVFTHGGVLFVEAKHKSVFTWHRLTRRWTTGIDIRHYDDYQRVAARTGTPVWLLFYHRESTPKQRDIDLGSPMECPSGLFGNELWYLVRNENHRSKPFNPNRAGYLGHGHSGMVYWRESSLKKIAAAESMR